MRWTVTPTFRIALIAGDGIGKEVMPERIADAKLIRSMSRKGCSPDNARCEGIFGRSKNRAVLSQS